MPVWHRWRPVLGSNRASGCRPKKGRSAIFNEYMASYQHDWEDVTCTEQNYRDGYRADTVSRPVHHASYQDDDFTFKT